MQEKQTVTFSLNNMGEFSHEELQQVILKYDGEYKRMKKSQTGNFGTLLYRNPSKYKAARGEMRQS
jgi:hypothetical protein